MAKMSLNLTVPKIDPDQTKVSRSIKIPVKIAYRCLREYHQYDERKLGSMARPHKSRTFYEKSVSTSATEFANFAKQGRL